MIEEDKFAGARKLSVYTAKAVAVQGGVQIIAADNLDRHPFKTEEQRALAEDNGNYPFTSLYMTLGNKGIYNAKIYGQEYNIDVSALEIYDGKVPEDKKEQVCEEFQRWAEDMRKAYYAAYSTCKLTQRDFAQLAQQLRRHASGRPVSLDILYYTAMSEYHDDDTRRREKTIQMFNGIGQLHQRGLFSREFQPFLNIHPNGYIRNHCDDVIAARDNVQPENSDKHVSRASCSIF